VGSYTCHSTPKVHGAQQVQEPVQPAIQRPKFTPNAQS